MGLVRARISLENFGVFEECIYLLSLHSASKMKLKSCESDISNFVRVLKKIKGDFTGLDSLLHRCKTEKLSASQVLEHLRNYSDKIVTD